MILPSVLSRSPEATYSQVGDETVILHFGSGTYFGLDPVGTRIWTLLEDPQSLASLHSALSQEFDVPTEVLAADIQTFLENLYVHNIVVEA